MAFGTFTFTGHFEGLTGIPASGKVRIDGNPQVITDTAGDKIRVGPRTVILDSAGNFSITLPSDATTGNSTGIAYRVTTDLKGLSNIAPLNFYARPISATVDLADLVNVAIPELAILPAGPKGATGATGPQGPQGLPGVNAVANDTATASQINTPGTATDTALKALYGRGHSITEYGAVGDGSTNNNTAIQAALNAIPATGGLIFIPRGIYIVNAPLAVKPRTTIIGEGDSSRIFSTHTGSTLTLIHAGGSDVADYFVGRDFTVLNNNGANVGGGIEVVSGQEHYLNRVTVQGHKYGAILDGAQISTFEACMFNAQLATGASAWLTSGPDRTAGVLPNGTNRITFRDCDFNCQSTGSFGIVDDGGWSHSYVDNNYNFGDTQIRLAGTSAARVAGGEFENAATRGILLTKTKWLGATAGTNVALRIESATISTGGLATPVGIEVVAGSVYSLSLTSNSFLTTAVAVKGTANIDHLFSAGNYQSTAAALFDGVAINHTAFDRSGSRITPTMQTPVRVSTSGVQFTLQHPSYKEFQFESRWDGSKSFRLYNATDAIDIMAFADGGAVTFRDTINGRAFKETRATPAFTGSLSLNFINGGLQMVTLTGNVTSLGFANGQTDCISEVHLIQDATGSRTLAGAASNIKWAGGTAPTLSTGANKRDIFRFRYDGANFYELTRSMNVG